MLSTLRAPGNPDMSPMAGSPLFPCVTGAFHPLTSRACVCTSEPHGFGLHTAELTLSLRLIAVSALDREISYFQTLSTLTTPDLSDLQHQGKALIPIGNA